MRSHFDEQLAELKRELIKMGALCEEAIALAARALISGETALTAKVVSVDDEIDHMERTIESMCLRLLLQQQPVARDLRQISAALKMITDMERIGDQASDIAEIIGCLDASHAGSCEYIGEMARAAIKMVTGSVDAYVGHDMKLAEDVIAQDDIVDEQFRQVRAILIKMISDDPESGEFALDILMIAKYFERIGDHAVNIAEWVVFSITGEHIGSHEQQ